MFNVGGAEFLVIAFVALIILGPDKLPEAARKIGNVMGELRQMSSGFKRSSTAP
jgi:sec-independent protein translocase protein TatB